MAGRVAAYVVVGIFTTSLDDVSASLRRSECKQNALYLTWHPKILPGTLMNTEEMMPKDLVNSCY